MVNRVFHNCENGAQRHSLSKQKPSCRFSEQTEVVYSSNRIALVLVTSQQVGDNSETNKWGSRMRIAMVS